MQTADKHSQRGLVCVKPLSGPGNPFQKLFAQALSDEGYLVREFYWRNLCFKKMDFVIFHWPDEFFLNLGPWSTFKVSIKLVLLRIARILRRTRLVWVAHNTAPHDAASTASRITHWFLRSLSGVVFLSERSRTIMAGLYPELAGCRSLVTVHGHYRNVSATPIREWKRPVDTVHLIGFGLIRPYKNVEMLVDTVRSIPSGIRLTVSGWTKDDVLREAIQSKAKAAPQIVLNLRNAMISDNELEAILDASDAVVLPYKKILNSGSALFALSRNRPVLAPNIGSLPELRDTVGANWVYLYDGEFSRDILLDFKDWLLNTERPSIAKLDAYDWSRVGKDLYGFLSEIP